MDDDSSLIRETQPSINDDEISVQDVQLRRRLEFEEADDFVTPSKASNIDIENRESIHSKLPTEIVPQIGMEFESEDAAYKFYNIYAREVGFSIRKNKSHAVNDKVLDRVLVCAREGKRGIDKRAHASTNHRRETRCQCPAKFKVSCRQSDKYKIIQFVPDHNHNLATPSKAHLFRSQRNMSLAQAAQIDMVDDSGIAPRLGFELLAKEAGGVENVGYTRVDYKNHLRTKRSIGMKSGDASGILEYLQQKQSEDPNFFYAIQVDEDDLITNIFWADAKMMADYEVFGDVVCFDTTYRKHKDGRPIALFVGVNHHKQTCIFGVALLYDETAETFTWLFDAFSKAMDGKLPRTMLTDQDAAMAKALVSQWPQTYHRLCVWHIFQNAANHLSFVFSKYKEFSRDFSSCVYDYEHESDFLDAWSSMLIKYDLESNDWLKRMINIKEKWTLVYGRDTFCADMTTTQRAESMNKHIKHYVNYKHDLRRFFSNFERLLKDRRYDERTADFDATQSSAVLHLHVEILKHAASIYTPAVFNMFELELSKAYDCVIVERDGTEELMRYTIRPHKKQYKYVVSYNMSEETISCRCRKFEFAGILCGHALKVFSDRGVTKIPNKYIHKRWTINAKKTSIRKTLGLMPDEDPKVIIGRRYRDLCRLSTRLTTRAAESEEAYVGVREGLNKLFEQFCLNIGDNSIQPTTKESHVVTNEKGDRVMDSTGVMKTVKGLKVKKKTGTSSKRPKGALETARKRQRGKQKVPSLDTGGVSITSQVIQSQVGNSYEFQTPSLSSETILQQEHASRQTTSYQELLGMDYSAAENLLLEFLEPIGSTKKDQAQVPPNKEGE